MTSSSSGSRNLIFLGLTLVCALLLRKEQFFCLRCQFILVLTNLLLSSFESWCANILSILPPIYMTIACPRSLFDESAIKETPNAWVS